MCGPWINSISNIWEFPRNVGAQPPWIRICMLTKPPGDCCRQETWRCTDMTPRNLKYQPFYEEFWPVYLQTLASECWFLCTKTLPRDTAGNENSLRGPRWNDSESPFIGSGVHFGGPHITPVSTPPVPHHLCHLPQWLCLLTQDAHPPFYLCSGSVFQRCRKGVMVFKQCLAEQQQKNWSFATWRKKCTQKWSNRGITKNLRGCP